MLFVLSVLGMLFISLCFSFYYHFNNKEVVYLKYEGREKQALDAAYLFWRDLRPHLVDSYGKRCLPSAIKIAEAKLPHDVLAAANLFGCQEDQVIYLSSKIRQSSFVPFCVTTLHEYGHLLGYDHYQSATPKFGPHLMMGSIDDTHGNEGLQNVPRAATLANATEYCYQYQGIILSQKYQRNIEK